MLRRDATVLVSVTTALAYILHAYVRKLKQRKLSPLHTDLTGAVDITCVWKLKGLGAAGVIGAPSPISSSAAIEGGGARKSFRGILYVGGSVNEGEEVSSITRIGGGVAVESGRERKTGGSIC